MLFEVKLPPDTPETVKMGQVRWQAFLVMGVPERLCALMGSLRVHLGGRLGAPEVERAPGGASSADR